MTSSAWTCLPSARKLVGDRFIPGRPAKSALAEPVGAYSVRCYRPHLGTLYLERAGESPEQFSLEHNWVRRAAVIKFWCFACSDSDFGSCATNSTKQACLVSAGLRTRTNKRLKDQDDGCISLILAPSRPLPNPAALFATFIRNYWWESNILTLKTGFVLK